MLCDSSPQVNYDWVWTQVKEISESDIVRSCKAVQHLATGVAAHVASWENEEEGFDDISLEPLAAWKQYLDDVMAIKTHVCAPTAVTSGQRGAAHKVRAQLHSFYLDCPTETSLNAFVDSIQCVCSDMGVEMAMADFSCTNLMDVLPHWMRRGEDEFAPDVEPHANDMSESELESELANDLEVEEPPPAPAIAAAPRPERTPRAFYMQNGVSTYGLQHCMDNLTKLVHQKLPVWKLFSDHLHNINVLLHMRERRERLCWTCVRGAA